MNDVTPSLEPSLIGAVVMIYLGALLLIAVLALWAISRETKNREDD